MLREKEKVYLNKFGEKLKNPPPDAYVLVYTEKKNGVKPVNKADGRVTLKQVVDMIQRLDAKVDTGFNELRQDIKDINARLDYNGLQIKQINKRLDYNGLKQLPKDK